MFKTLNSTIEYSTEKRLYPGLSRGVQHAVEYACTRARVCRDTH